MSSIPLPLSAKLHMLNHGSIKASRFPVSLDFKGTLLSTHERVGTGKMPPNPGGNQHLKENYHLNFNAKVFAASGVSTAQTEQVFTVTTEVDRQARGFSYLFRTEIGGLVKVVVRKTDAKYVVFVEVSSLELGSGNDRLLLSGGIYTSDSTSVDSKSFFQTPLNQTSAGRHALELEFEEEKGPFFLSFLLKCLSEGHSDVKEIRSHRLTRFCVPVGIGPGRPFPLGISFCKDGSINFAVFSRNAEGVVLCLYDDLAADQPALELDLDNYVNCSGDVWHLLLADAWKYAIYGYRYKGKDSDGYDSRNVRLDPYAKILGNSKSSTLGSGSSQIYLGRLATEPSFDWAGDLCPNILKEKLMVYRLNVKRFTEHKSSQLPMGVAGTFSGVAEKLDHLAYLGVNAVLLEPIFPYNKQKGPYSPSHFFSPMNLSAPSGDLVSMINSMKDMVKRLHSNGIEVFLEVVFTHNAELQGIDDLSYYYVNRVEELAKRNILNCNYPIAQQLILESLRYWVTEFHVDGFCFMNASYLLRGFHGESLSRPPLIEAIAFDPVLSRTKIIADCWDPIDLTQKDVQFPHWKRWAEMNAKYSTDVRNFLRGEGMLSSLATRLCGSGDIFFHGRAPAFSFNFISRNFGLSLVDLVSFSSSDLASEFSWNCGAEGATSKAAILERRLKQIRNFLFILYVSLGVPVLNMGDECGQSTGGSIAYKDRKPLDWTSLDTSFGTQAIEFISFMSSLRKRRSDLLQKRDFLKEENIDWHGSDQSSPNWDDPSCRFLAMTLKADRTEGQSSSNDLFLAFNAAGRSERVLLPVPGEGKTWRRLVDTALPFPGFFSSQGEPVIEQMPGLFSYDMKSHSCALFEASKKGA